MAIQHRRGDYTDFDPTKLKPGEYAVALQNDPMATDGEGVYMAFGAGRVKRMATLEELHSYDQSARASADDAETAKESSQEILNRMYEAIRYWTATDPNSDGNIVIGRVTQ